MSDLSLLLEPYDAVFFDVWGVLFDGESLLPGALEALETVSALRFPAVLITNASWPAELVRRLLIDGGLPEELLPPVLTAGDVAGGLLASQWRDARVYVHGNERHQTLIGDLRRADSPSTADVILGALAQPLPDSSRDAAARGVPLLCANPDLDAPTSRGVLRCAGATAAEYRELGGPVVLCGKPDRRIYQAARDLLGCNKPLAIGDSIPTDLVGAQNAGIDALLINTRGYSAEALRDELAVAGVPAPVAVWPTLAG